MLGPFARPSRSRPKPVRPSGGHCQAKQRRRVSPISPRSGTKIAQVIDLLQSGDGATLAELVAATGWLPHTTRAALTGLRKRGYAVRIDRTDKARGSVYRIGPTECATIAPNRASRRRRLAKRRRIAQARRGPANPSGGVMVTRRTANGSGEASVPPAVTRPRRRQDRSPRAGRCCAGSCCWDGCRDEIRPRRPRGCG